MSSIKSLAVYSAIAASLFMASNAAKAASDSVPVNVTATVVNNTCTPTWSATGVNVGFNRVAVKDFGSDKIGGSKNFTLTLGQCGSDATKVTVSASGSPDATDASLFANSVSTSSGVGVGIWGGPTQVTKMKPDGSNSVEYTITNSGADMIFTAKLMKTGATTPVAGEVKSTVTMLVTYQ